MRARNFGPTSLGGQPAGPRREADRKDRARLTEGVCAPTRVGPLAGWNFVRALALAAPLLFLTGAAEQPGTYPLRAVIVAVPLDGITAIHRNAQPEPAAGRYQSNEGEGEDGSHGSTHRQGVGECTKHQPEHDAEQDFTGGEAARHQAARLRGSESRG